MKTDPFKKSPFAAQRNSWNEMVSRWLLMSDNLFEMYETGKNRFHSEAQAEAQVGLRESRVFKFTLVGLFLVTLSILVSCQAPHDMTPMQAPLRPQMHIAGGVRDRDPLYIRRDSQKIMDREVGSKSGSIWSDTATPRHLLADHRPTRTGEFVTVRIPEEFQPPPSPPKPGEAPQPTPTPGNRNAPAVAVGIKLSTVKMEIIALESMGDVYLRARKSMQTSLGLRKEIIVFAKVPRRLITGYEVNAQDLTGVQVTVDDMGLAAEYEVSGWDSTVTSALLGLYPKDEKPKGPTFPPRNAGVSAADQTRDQSPAPPASGATTDAQPAAAAAATPTPPAAQTPPPSPSPVPSPAP
jgi:hypothetical protein